MSGFYVYKFGGTSVGKPERMITIKNIITENKNPKIIVLSALSGTTNILVEISNLVKEKKYKEIKPIISNLKNHYIDFITKLFKDNEKYFQEILTFINIKFSALEKLAKSRYTSFVEREILSYGEILSTNIFYVLLKFFEIKCELINALEFIKKNEDGEPDLLFISTNIKKLVTNHDVIYITQGYICKDHKNKIDNLARGGSDYSASLIGEGIIAKEIQIWTDIDGLHNNDPRIVDKTYSISEVSFDEAAELAYFGAKILHPASVLPAKRSGIPVILKNTLNPKDKGTIISNKSVGSQIKAVAAKDGITAISIKSSRMLLAYGFLRKVFEVFEKNKTSIDMITTSEVAVSLTIDDAKNLDNIIKELNKFGNVEVNYNMTIVCMVGSNICDNIGMFVEVFEYLKDVPIRMISYGGSKNNISILVETTFKKDVLQHINKYLYMLHSNV